MNDLGLFMGKFREFFAELSARYMSVFTFLDDNLSKYQSIFTKLGMCIDIVDIWFWITSGGILSFFDIYLPTMSLLIFCLGDNLSK